MRVDWRTYVIIGCGFLFAASVRADDCLRFDFEPSHIGPLPASADSFQKSCEVRPCTEAPEVDGVANDACWRNAAILDDFAVAEPPTQVFLCYDTGALHILVHCRASGQRTATGVQRPRDASFRLDDRVHFVFKPDLRSDEESLFQINSGNSIYDALNGDESWDPEWSHAVQCDNDGWYAEATIPFEIFGLNAPPMRLGFNVGRAGPALMRRSWNNVLHQSAAASSLILKNPDNAKDCVEGAAGAIPVSSANVVMNGHSLGLFLERDYARVQDRWLDATVTVAPEKPLADTRLEAKLFSLSGREAIAVTRVVPTGRKALLSIDLRRVDLSKAELTVRCFEDDQCTGLVKTFISARSRTDSTGDQRIPVRIDIPVGEEKISQWPVTFGVPFPRGALWDIDALAMVDESGRQLPCQKEVTGRWAREGSIQWVRFDALINSESSCFVTRSEVSARPRKPVRVTRQGDKLSLDTGVATYVLSRGPSPVSEIRLDGRATVTAAGTRGLYVVDQRGRLASASAEGETMVVEADGPVAACVRFEGFYRTKDGEPLARHITRVEANAGQPFARITHTLVLTQDTNDVWFREVGWEFASEVGAQARAKFNASRSDPHATTSVPLSKSGTAVMLQDEHVRFGGGTNHFSVTSEGGPLAEGKECGDWALLQGNAAGFAVACKDTARQHPKAFVLSPDRVRLELFSNRAGKELDFRAKTLVAKWNLDETLAAKAGQLESNAAGWSKTHELMLVPARGEDATAQVAKAAALHSDPVYALVDPAWIRGSDAMGPLHPRAPEEFPAVEAFIDRMADAFTARGHEPGHYGFVDYFAGPTYSGGSGYCGAGRYRFTYGLRSAIWLTYARSGDREIRDFAEGTNKAYLDNYVVHWPSEKNTRGLFTANGGQPMSGLPFYWGRGSTYNISSSTNLDQFLWLYHLTGYRRAGDAVNQFAEGLKESWKADMSNWRVIMVFRVLAQCYGFTWDPKLRSLAEATFENFVDREGELLLTKNRPYGSSSYKTGVDIRGLIDAWRLFGTPRYRDVCLAVSRHWWHRCVGGEPITYMNPLGIIGDFLYEQTQDPAVPAGLRCALLRAGAHDTGIGASSTGAVFETLPYAMDVVARSGGERIPWVAYKDYAFPSSVVAQKSRDGILDLTVRAAGGDPGRQFSLKPVGIVTRWGQDLTTVIQRSAGAASARVPKDAPQGAYEIVPNAHGAHFVLAATRTPMVLHAPNYWVLPDIKPTQPIYFRLPADCDNTQIFFEGPARLYAPDGTAFGDPQGLRGWVNLPSDEPGLWHFRPISNRLVRRRNFPPFFAFGAPEFYFEPPIDWKREPPERPKKEDATPEQKFVQGAIETSHEDASEKALNLVNGRFFELEAGPEHQAGDGGLFLPHKRGTIEFFLKPYWSTFELGAGDVKKRFIYVQGDKSSWALTYRVDPDGVRENLAPKDPSHSLHGVMYLDNPRRSKLRAWLTQTLFERDRWSHVAWSWGPEVVYGPHQEKLNLMTMRIFVDGRGIKQVIFRSAADALPLGVPDSLRVDSLKGAIDELRVSDIQRYENDFDPPSREKPFAVDEHTRALFHFNDTVTGQSSATDQPLPARAK